MREGKFLEINKKPTNYFIGKDKMVSGKKFSKATNEYESILARKAGDINERLSENTIELSSEQERVLNEVLEAAKEVSKKYAGREVHMKRSQIVIVPKGTLAAMNVDLFEGIGGQAMLHLQRVAVEIDHHDSNSALADKVFHELMHLGSLFRMRFADRSDDPVLGHYHAERAGLKVLNRDGSTKFFDGLDEALTEKLSLGYLQDQKNNPLYAEDFTRGQEVFGNEIENGVLNYSKNEGGDVVPVMNHAYQDEIIATSNYIEGIFQNNPDRFGDVEEVWEIFFRAKFTGRLRKLARLIENTGGKGEFRRLGEVSNG